MAFAAVQVDGMGPGVDVKEEDDMAYAATQVEAALDAQMATPVNVAPAESPTDGIDPLLAAVQQQFQD